MAMRSVLRAGRPAALYPSSTNRGPATFRGSGFVYRSQVSLLSGPRHLSVCEPVSARCVAYLTTQDQLQTLYVVE
jgi:hypothetical protein